MRHFAKCLAVCLTVIATTAHAQDEDAQAESYAAALAAMEDVSVWTESCVAPPAEVKAQGPLIAELLLTIVPKAPYAVKFDEAAAAEMLAMMRAAATAAKNDALLSEVLSLSERSAGRQRAQMMVQDLTNELDRGGVNIDSVMDVAALYLISLSAARDGDFAIITGADQEAARRLMKPVRDQLLLAEARCFTLGAKGADLGRVRNLLIARVLVMSLGMRSAEKEGDTGLAEFKAAIGETSGRQIEGLRLTPDGFVED